MSDIPTLLHQMGSDQIDLKRQIVVSLAENPFLDGEIEALASRVSHPVDLVGRAVEDLCSREVLVQSGWGGLGLSPSPAVYAPALRLAAELGRDGASVRKRIYEKETSERFKQQLAVSRKEVEAILDIVPAGLMIFDLHGHLLKSNPAAWRILGLVRDLKDEKALWSALGIGGPEGFCGSPLSSLSPGGGEHRWEIDRTPPVEVVARPFSIGPRGNGLILAVRDITDRRAAEEACARLREDFFSMIRHELLKPLLGVERALGSFGLDAWMEESEREALLDGARRGMQRLKGMVDDMLLLARLERDPMAVTPRDQVLLTLLLTGADLSFRDRAAEMGIALKSEVPDDEVEFRGDEKRLLQVIDNLLDNALKFTPPGGSVILSGRRLRGGGRMQHESLNRPGQSPLEGPSAGPPLGGGDADWVEITVSDTGVGIPPEEQDRVFGKFYQVQQGPDRRDGLGLGLAICQRIVAAHRGEVRIVSKPGHGTTVRVLIPAPPVNPSKPE